MSNEINNCGLVALRNISDLKSISVRTLINLAEDNGVKLYPYKLTNKEIQGAELPAIFHSDNHFVYISSRNDLGNYNLTGEVLFTKQHPYNIIDYNNTYSIKGQWVAAGVASAALTLAAAKWISGNSKEKKAKKAREKLTPAFYDIQDEYYQNKNSAANMAEGGLPAATKDYYTTQSEKGLSAGIQGILQGGGNPNDISKLYQTYDDSVAKISAADAETHLNNIKYYMGVNKDLAGQKTIQWAINKQQPYLNTLKELSAAQKAGEATKNEAYGDAMSALSSFGTSMSGSGGSFGGGSKGGGTGGGDSTYAKMFSNSAGTSGAGGSGHSTNFSTNNGMSDPFGGVGDFAPTGGGGATYEDYLNWMNQNKKI